MKTYLMLHPSSKVCVDLIFKKLNKQNYRVEDVFVVRDWGELMMKIYSFDFYQFECFQDHIESHIYVNNYFFGKNGLLITLSKNIEFSELAKQTIETKKEIRQLVEKTRDGTISMLVDVNRIVDEKRGNNGTICLMQNGKVQDFETTMTQEGRMMSVFFTYVHCPDPDIRCYERDYKILAECMTDENRLSETDIENVINFKSYEVRRWK